MAVRTGLLKEIVAMAFDTIRANKMRSGLTVLGVVIGITSIVGMTALIRGFDQSLRDSIAAVGPDTIFIAKFSGVNKKVAPEHDIFILVIGVPYCYSFHLVIVNICRYSLIVL